MRVGHGISLLIFGSAILNPTISHSEFVYFYNIDVNNVSAFSVSESGAMTELPESPFMTGGEGLAVVYFADTIVTCRQPSLLLTANHSSSSVSSFAIDQTTGSLVPTPGPPFNVGAFAARGIAVSPDCRFLMVVVTRPDPRFYLGGITVFSISENGVLTPVNGSPFPAPFELGGPLKVTPDGRFLVAGDTLFDDIHIFNIDIDGVLTPVPGSPFAAGRDSPTSFGIRCRSDLLFTGSSNFSFPTNNSYLRGFEILANGSLVPISNSPFLSDGGIPYFVKFDPSDRHIYSANADASHSGYVVSEDGQLNSLLGSPFAPLVVGENSTGIAFNAGGTRFFSSTFSFFPFGGAISSYDIALDGSLTPSEASPNPISIPSFLNSIATFPPKTCSVSVLIDLMPGSEENPINPMSEGLVPLAIFGSDEFDVNEIDSTSLRFGPNAAEIDHDHGPHFSDENGDGALDLVAHFNIEDSGIAFGNQTTCISGSTRSGLALGGCDAVRTVPDIDGDDLTDLEELSIGTNPNHPDSDGDSFQDGEEVLSMGTDPLDPKDPKLIIQRRSKRTRR